MLLEIIESLMGAGVFVAGVLPSSVLEWVAVYVDRRSFTVLGCVVERRTKVEGWMNRIGLLSHQHIEAIYMDNECLL